MWKSITEAVMEKVMEQIEKHLKHRAGERLAIEAVLFTNDRGILGETAGAKGMMEQVRRHR